MPVTPAEGGGLSVSRLFTLPDVRLKDMVEWTTRTATIKGKGGTIFQMDNVEAPKEWSQLAVDIVASKYLRKAGVPTDKGTGAETSVRELISRVSIAIMQAGEQQKYFATLGDAQAFVDELAYILVTQRAAFNSPVWFNCGLAERYGIKGERAGNWVWEERRSMAIPTTDAYTHPQVSACFIQSIEDDLGDIAEHVGREMRVFKHGSGSGSNYSNLRGRGEPLSNGGQSSGLMSFLEVFDRAAGAIKSGGTTRRAAKMVVLDVDHPDIEEFIDWKVREEEKVRALAAAGFSSGIDGEAQRTVGGQNANNSVSASDEFMRAVEDDGEWSTSFRTSGETARTYNARELLRKIADAAWRCAEPGMQFSGNINRWHTCSGDSEIRSSNPCSEYLFVDNSSCNLASLNLVKFFDGDETTFKAGEFRHVVEIVFLAQDILVDYASYPTKTIAENSHRYRPLGLGYANLGAMLMRAGVPYDSERGRLAALSVTAYMTGLCYRLSALIAGEKGPFPAYTHNIQSMMDVIGAHQDQVRVDGLDAYCPIDVPVADVWKEVRALGITHGFRNAQATLLAPTGTIAFLMDCDTTGIEPDLALVKAKKLAGGGTLEIHNQSVAPAMRVLGYSQHDVETALRWLTTEKTIEGTTVLRDEHLPVFACANDISPQGHLAMMAAVQPYLSGGISKTVNLPSSATVEDIERLYVEAWRNGIKALAVYRADSKAAQVLKSAAMAPEPTQGRQRLPTKRYGFIQEARVGGQKLYVRTGEYPDGRLGEVFIDMHKEGATMRSMTNSFAIAVSLGLQHGVPLEEFVNAFVFSNFSPNGVVQGHPNIKHASSVLDYIMRLLAFEYLGQADLVQVKPDGEADELQVIPPAPPSEVVADAHACTECGSLATRRNGTCYVCTNCGTQTGCA